MNVNALSAFKTVHGTWHRASSSAEVDVEAQMITGTHGPLVLPVAPELARAAPVHPHISDTRTTTTTATSADAVASAIDDFFGATRESRHDSCPSLGRGSIVLSPPPPPYTDAELPAYSEGPDAEPATLAKYLFKYGFLCPPLWILGSVMLVSPLVAPAEFERAKPGAERARIVRVIRDAEVRWAWRCVRALGALLVLVIVIALIVLIGLYG